MRIIKPKRLRRGDVIGICAPAGALASPDAIDKGISYLERLGYRVHLGNNVYKRRGYLAGSDRQRVDDLHEMFRNKHVRAIFSARGGFGSQRIVPLLNYALIRKNPKMVVGFSDITALHLALFSKSGLVSLSAPLVVEMPLRGQAEEIFWRALTSVKPLGVIRPTDKPIFYQPGRHATATGTLIGGNVSLISAMLGSSYFPALNNPLLFLEEIDERPYRVDRTLQHIRLNNIFGKLQGVILGTFIGCTPVKGRPSLKIQQVFHDALSDAPFPVVSGLRFGHIRNSLSIPFGVIAKIDGKRNQLEIRESLVS
ncbi:MAG TPA: LD-carboxypeptidase [Bacteroidota bacterium]|nr:LD-carboxypeptidase [Bacteroidota bacterium]